MAKGLFIVTVLTLVWSSWGGLNCASQLRIIFPELFAHCTSCTYSDWSEWQVVQDSIVDVPTNQCRSGQAYSESRSRVAIMDGISGECDPETETETRVICLPDREERFIEALGLGRTANGEPEPAPAKYTAREGYKHSPFMLAIDDSLSPTDETPQSDPYLHRSGRQVVSLTQNRCPGTGSTGLICTDPSYDSRSKRSLKKEYRPFKRATRERKEPAPLPEAPIPYDRKEHGGRFRRSHHMYCQPNGEQYILFVLDTSGSIGRDYFTRMTTAVSWLTGLFCMPPKIAVMTFNHYFNLEFCFDCYSTNHNGRRDAAAAIRGISWRSGLTFTGGAARCVCDELLTPSCGMDQMANCVDVVFITDGKSNDRNLSVCEEVKCLHTHFNRVNTYAIGIKNFYKPEIQCISSSSSLISVFEYEDFQEFEEAIDYIVRLLSAEDNPYTCVDTHGDPGTG